MIDINELRMLAQAALAGPDGISLNWIKLLQDFQQKTSPAAVIEILNRLESAEKERDVLKALVAEMENQEPAYWGPKHAIEGGSTTVIVGKFPVNPTDAPLYALPGAKGEEK